MRGKDTHIAQCCKVVCPEIGPHIDFWPRPKSKKQFNEKKKKKRQFNGERIVFQKMVPDTNIHMIRKMNIDPYLIHYTKINTNHFADICRKTAKL